MTGQSIVTAQAVEALRDVAEVAVANVHLGDTWAAGAVRRARAWGAGLAAFRQHLRGGADAVYLTPASSRHGSLRDLAAAALVPAHVPIIGHVHVGDYDRILADVVLGPSVRRLARRLARIITPSEFAAAPFRAQGLRVTVVPNAVEAVHLRTAAEVEDAWAIRQRRPPVVAFLSNMIPAKGYEVLVRAVAALGPELAVRLRVGGAWSSAAERARYERLAAQLGVEVDIVGAVARAEVPAFLADTSVFAFPSHLPESFGVVVAEAMAAGCAIAAIDRGAIRELVRDGVDGRIAPYRADPDAQTAALAAALRDAVGHAERYGRSASARAREHFAPERFARAIQETILDVLTPARS